MATLIVVEDLAHPFVIGRGGHAMHLLQMLEGLRRLGHRVIFAEFLEEPPDEAHVRYFSEVIADWWTFDAAALLDLRGAGYAGLEPAGLARLAAEADAVITQSAHYRREPWPLLENVTPRILIDLDPGYTHLWAAEGDPLDIYGEQDLHFTVGVNIGTPRCSLPTLGIDWRPTFPPVVLDFWRGEPPISRDRFTTIAGWRDYGYLEFEGRLLGPKVEEFEKFLGLPRLAGEPVELALTIDSDDPDHERLLADGWLLESPRVAWSPAQYRDYISGSLGEFGVAKGGYVGTRCGWFSDRSACYLAAGRPVLLQATGFEDVLPTGEGLFAVSTVDEAADAIAAVRGDYARHSRAAREIAREFLASDKVLGRMLAAAGIS
jgi:hypothetical protein